MTTNVTTDSILKWIAGIGAAAIASMIVWKATNMETDIRSFAVSIAEVRAALTYQKESIDTMAFQLHELQNQLRNREVAMGE